ncbi:MAG TPA: hypothetical protein VH164_09855 [Ktedonobacteraceae bacterium]|nr:hypothetical protein [Ktedonobacteraceae bacterium]
MSVGQQPTKASIDQSITAIAVQYRNLCQAMHNLNTQINGGGSGLAYLQAIGYANTADSLNPGSIGDAQYALNLIGYFSTLSGVYYGTVQQGGSGGTGASDFNFDNALSPMWQGQ